MSETLSGSFGLRFLIAAVIVALALAGFFAAVAYIRRRNPGMPFLGQPRSRHHRLNVVDSVVVDARRRLVLVRRDNVEHLLLIGGGSDLVIEQGLDAPYEAADPGYEDTSYYAEDEEPEETYVAEPEPEPRRAAPQRPASPADESIGLRYTASWEDDDFSEPALKPARKVDLPPDLSDIERLPNEPPVGTIRPVALQRPEPARIETAPLQPPPQAEPAISPEEAAIARELEAARRRAQGATARPSLPPPSASQGSRIDFDRVLEQEMEDQLESARRMAVQSQAAAQQPRSVTQQPRPAAQPAQTGQARPVGLPLPPRSVSQQAQPRPAAPQDPRSIQSGMARIFGDGPGNGGDTGR